MRSVIWQSIVDDPTLSTLGVVPAGVLSGHVDTPSARPFLNLRWGLTRTGISGTLTDRQDLTIWVHDIPNDYRRINFIVARLRVLLTSIEDEVDPSGGRVTAVGWNGDSADLLDDGHETIVRNTSFVLVGRAGN